MKSYRIAFFVALSVAIVLAGALAYLWFHPHAAMAHNAPSTRERVLDAQPSTSPEIEPSLAPVTLTPERMQSIGVKTGVVGYKQVQDEIRTTGDVEVDETKLAEVQVRFSGWIQKVYADATFQRIRKGQPLLTIYSPDLVTTENEYLLAKQNRDSLAQSTVPGVAAGASSLLSSLWNG